MEALYNIKYYRPRGLFSISPLDSMVRVGINGVITHNPNQVLINNSLRILIQDKKAPTLLKLAKRFLRVGFQHRFPIRHPTVWRMAKKLLVKYANLPPVTAERESLSSERVRVERLSVDLAVVGGWFSGDKCCFGSC
ncbi:MAG: hypothetical protein ACTSX9_05425 [Candidatus Njordarchaeales archaeon]